MRTRTDSAQAIELRYPAWQSVLSGSLAERAVVAVQEIGAAAKDTPPCVSDLYSLPGGTSGIALFYAYLAMSDDATAHESTAAELLERSIDAQAHVWMPSGLHGGITGITWTVEHLKGRLLDPEEDYGIGELDRLLLESLERSRDGGHVWTDGYDLIGGLAGLGVYALERLPDPRAKNCLELIVEALEQSAESQPSGITWFTPPEIIPPSQIEDYPNGYYNFGTAHGIPGIVSLLGRTYAAGISREVAGPLLEGAVAWLLAHENPAEDHSRFPTFIGPGNELRASRLAWCYGDPGLAATLYDAALSVGEPSWERKALDVAVDTARRPTEFDDTTDCGFCHGTAGLAHLFNRLYQLSGEEALRDAAVLYFRETLDRRVPGIGVAGYQSWGPGPGGETDLRWNDDPGFLTGATGIGLALMAAVTTIEPDWDRALLLPGRPGAAR